MSRPAPGARPAALAAVAGLGLLAAADGPGGAPPNPDPSGQDAVGRDLVGRGHVVILAEFFETDRIHAFDGVSGEHLGVLAASDPIRGPIGLALGPDGRVYVANATTNNVARFRPVSDGTGLVAGELEIFASAGLGNPYDLTFGPEGDLYVTSLGGNEVVRFDGRTGERLGTFASGPELDWPQGLAFGPDGDLYVSSGRTNRLLRYDGRTGEHLGALETGEALAAPAGLLFDDEGGLLIASADNHTIFRLADGELETLVASEAEGMRFPRLMDFGPDGRLWVAAGKRLLRFDPATGAFAGEFAATETSIATGFVFVAVDGGAGTGGGATE